MSELEQDGQDETGWNVDYAKRVLSSLRKWIEWDGFEYRDGKLTPIGKTEQLPDVHTFVAKYDAPELHRQIERMRDAVNDAPTLAIGTAKELIETICKTILAERGVPVNDG